ncbi:MAG TPA: dTDP-4-dehydrorhamnose 3,5-epimerase [Allosphingosinicella sp.]|jgi:dTDP-4-dehydrorhamnose 3,5-epimerase
MLDVRPLGLGGAAEIRPRKFGDERGFFSETWNAAAMKEAGFELDFVQDNHSYSAARGVLRGLHFQLAPAAQDKLVRVSRGAIYDVVVDIRRGSPTFGKWAGLVVSAELWNQVLVPKGFAHGFVTIEEDTEVQYKVTSPYRPDLERSIRFDDPEIGIDWPVAATDVQLSAKDRDAPFLRDVETGFE